MQPTTPTTHTPLRVMYPDGGDTFPAYRSVIACPACNGDGEYEVQLPARSIVQESPEHAMQPCTVCGGGDDTGPGWLPVLACAATHKIIRQDDIEDAMKNDEEFEAAIAALDPDEALLWQRGPDVGKDDLARIEFTTLGDAHERLAVETDRLVSVAARTAHAQHALQHSLERDGMRISTGVHGVPAGVLLHLATDVHLWKGKRPARLTGEYQINTVVGPHPRFVTLFQAPWEGVPPEYAAWAEDAGLATPVQGA